MSLGDPTPDQITLAQTNINNCMDWINHCHDYMQDVINEVYSKVSEDPSSDPGQSFANNLIDDLLWGIGGVSFPGNAFVSAFLANLFWSYVSNPPPSLQGVIGDVWARFDKSFLQANDDLATIYADVAGHWNDTFKNPVTGEETAVSGFGDGSVTMPAKDAPLFQTMTDSAIADYRLALAKQLLPAKWFVVGDPKGWFVKDGNSAFIANYLKQYWGNFQAYYFTYHSDTGGEICPEKGITILENFLGTGSSDPMFAGKAPDDLCNWLFKDDGYGRTTNASGLAMRHDVFCNWGLKNSLPASAPNVGGTFAATASTTVDVEAEKIKAHDWHSLFDSIPRKELEQRVIEMACRDPNFLRMLMKNPKEAIEKFLDVQFPEGSNFEVIQETPGNYKMVIPLIGRPK